MLCRAFCRDGGVFLRRTRRAKAEIINDYSRDVSNFFRILQRHYPAFIDIVRYQVTSRAEFERLVKTDPETLTDLERSARFLYLLKTGFGGKVVGHSFGVDTTNFGRFDITKLIPALEDLHDRLAGVTIESLNYPDFIVRYDRPHTLFYLDPPYYGCEGDYGRHLFSRADFERISGVLAGLQGHFILSLNDHPEVRRIFSAFSMYEVKTTYTIAKGDNQHEAIELLIHNLPSTPASAQAALF